MSLSVANSVAIRCAAMSRSASTAWRPASAPAPMHLRTPPLGVWLAGRVSHPLRGALAAIALLPGTAATGSNRPAAQHSCHWQQPPCCPAQLRRAHAARAAHAHVTPPPHTHTPPRAPAPPPPPDECLRLLCDDCAPIQAHELTVDLQASGFQLHDRGACRSCTWALGPQRHAAQLSPRDRPAPPTSFSDRTTGSSSGVFLMRSTASGLTLQGGGAHSRAGPRPGRCPPPLPPPWPRRAFASRSSATRLPDHCLRHEACRPGACRAAACERAMPTNETWRPRDPAPCTTPLAHSRGPPTTGRQPPTPASPLTCC